MRYSDEHALAFIHIPKCAGNAVIDSLDSRMRQTGPEKRKDRGENDGGGWDDKTVHPELGPIHWAHVPIAYLRSHLPANYALVASGRSFGLLRDPTARFSSAVTQRMREFLGFRAEEITQQNFAAEATRAMEWLKARELYCDRDHIHFAPQHWFAEDGSTGAAPTRLFAIERMEELEKWLSAIFGEEFTIEQVHVSHAAKGSYGGLHKAIAATGRTLFPESARKALTPLLYKLPIYNKTSTRFELPAEVKAFIKQYYAVDFEWHREAKEQGAIDARPVSPPVSTPPISSPAR